MQSQNKNETLLTRRAAAEYLRTQGYPVAVATLATLVTRGGGPNFIKFGSRRVLYRTDELLHWAEGKLSLPRANSSQEAV